MVHAILEFIFSATLRVIEILGYWGVFGLSVLESANIPVPSEVIMPFSGFLAARGSFSFWWVVFLGGLGNLVGSLISYWIAARLGKSALQNFSKYLLLNAHDIQKAEAFFDRFGNLSVFICRFLPVIRTFISFPAGVFRINILYFAAFTFAGSLLWSFFLAYLGFILGENWQSLHGYFRQADYAILALLIGGVVWWVGRHLRHRNQGA